MNKDFGTNSVSRSFVLRSGIFVAVLLLVLTAFFFRESLSEQIRATIGLGCFLGVIVACSSNIFGIRWRTVLWGLGLQIFFALFIFKFELGGVRFGYEMFSALAGIVSQFLEFTNVGSEFVFGVLASPDELSKVFPNGLVLAFSALPIIIFVSSVFAVLYHLGFLQILVKIMARLMIPLMRTSGAETLSATANIFMGQTEAPIIVKPYIPKMTESELLTLMVGGLATIAGSMFVIYMSLGADPVAMLTTSVMSAPCGLYLSKILIPEVSQRNSVNDVEVALSREHVNMIDAAASGASDGMRVAINVAAMLIAFLAFIAMFDFLIGLVIPGLSMARILSILFSPIASLLGVSAKDVPVVAELLGTKLVTNEFVAYIKMSSDYGNVLTARSEMLVTFALTGFANFGSIGIILGGIGMLAPTRRSDLARLSARALLAGFVVTLINASIVAILVAP
tara:strand:+ start:1278 stop:2633 length:1356 start_codon:yes stop_codon:yes gene_type:complete